MAVVLQILGVLAVYVPSVVAGWRWLMEPAETRAVARRRKCYELADALDEIGDRTWAESRRVSGDRLVARKLAVWEVNKEHPLHVAAWLGLFVCGMSWLAFEALAWALANSSVPDREIGRRVFEWASLAMQVGMVVSAIVLLATMRKHEARAGLRRERKMAEWRRARRRGDRTVCGGARQRTPRR